MYRDCRWSENAGWPDTRVHPRYATDRSTLVTRSIELFVCPRKQFHARDKRGLGRGRVFANGNETRGFVWMVILLPPLLLLLLLLLLLQAQRGTDRVPATVVTVILSLSPSLFFFVPLPFFPSSFLLFILFFY